MKRTPLLPLLALVLAACSTSAIGKRVIWPPPPEKERIAFVTSFRTEEDVDRSGWSRFKWAILGGKPTVMLQQPMGLALSEDGQRLYIADLRGSQLVRVNFEAQTLRAFATGHGFAQPFGIALDAQENVYVTDSAARTLSKYDIQGNLGWSVSKGLERPTGLALDKERKLLYVADSSRVKLQNHRVLVYDLEGSLVRQVGSGRGEGEGQFNFPVYLALDRSGNLYVGDTMNFRIQVFDPAGKFLKLYGEHGDGPGTFARLKGIDFDSFGNAYVVDGQHSVVQMFNKEFQPLMFFGGFAPLLEYFDIPSCIAVDRHRNRIYVCNEQTPRINVYDLINTTAEDSFPEGGTAGPSPAR